MITRNITITIRKLECKFYAGVASYFMKKSIESVSKRNFGDGELYQKTAEEYYEKLSESMDKLAEVAL